MPQNGRASKKNESEKRREKLLAAVVSNVTLCLVAPTIFSRGKLFKSKKNCLAWVVANKELTGESARVTEFVFVKMVYLVELPNSVYRIFRGYLL